MRTTQPPISDYALIGDCRSAALVSRDGSIDWLCWPGFDSPSLFGALIDPEAGHWQIAPTTPRRIERRYVGDTNVLETRFATATGGARLTDLMPVDSEDDKSRRLLPDHEILRRVECDEGEVEIEMRFEPRPDYGRKKIRMVDWGKLGLRIELGSRVLVLRTDSRDPLRIVDGGVTAVLCTRLRAGERLHFSLTFAHDGLAVLPPLGDYSRDMIVRSLAWWNQWIARCTYQGPHRKAVLRSALALKLMVFAPSGAVVASPTTSLPEKVGADLNWDYRYCWLRDASLTVRALFGLGYTDEASAFVSWLLHTTRLTRPSLRILYDIYGNRPKRERTLDHLSGYRDSRPVRIGNAAVDQLQLDVYGEVVDATFQYACSVGHLDRETRKMLVSFGKYVCSNWQRPDEGIWESRSRKRCNTYSRLLCWTALDRLLTLHELGRLPEVPVELFGSNRDRIRREIETRGWNARIQSYVRELDGAEVDASLLLLPWYGFTPADSERMVLTYRQIKHRLGAGGRLLYRYRGGESSGEGAFGVCSFWGAEYLALGGGSLEEAQSVFENLLGYANDVGLYAEEIDPQTGAPIGNFPQLFTHVGLINTALTLARGLESRERRPASQAELEVRP